MVCGLWAIISVPHVRVINLSEKMKGHVPMKHSDCIRGGLLRTTVIGSDEFSLLVSIDPLHEISCLLGKGRVGLGIRCLFLY